MGAFSRAKKIPGLKLINPGISLFYPQDLKGILLSTKLYAFQFKQVF